MRRNHTPPTICFLLLGLLGLLCHDPIPVNAAESFTSTTFTSSTSSSWSSSLFKRRSIRPNHHSPSPSTSSSSWSSSSSSSWGVPLRYRRHAQRVEEDDNDDDDDDDLAAVRLAGNQPARASTTTMLLPMTTTTATTHQEGRLWDPTRNDSSSDSRSAETPTSSSSSSSSSSSISISSSSSSNPPEPKKNPVVSMVGLVKDSLQRTVTGTRQLWINHQRCNQIRQKMRSNTSPTLSSSSSSSSGYPGLTYADYLHLQQGKEDRGKLINLLFLALGAPRFLPYLLWFNGDGMLPQPWQAPVSEVLRQARAEQAARQRARAVVQTWMQVEQQVADQLAGAATGLSDSGGLAGMFNHLAGFFGGKARRQAQQEALLQVFREGQLVLQSPDFRQNMTQGASYLMKRLHPQLYRAGPTDFTRAQKRLVLVPPALLRGLEQALVGGASSSMGILSSLQPHFMHRGQVVGHVRKVTQADDFLVQADIDLQTLSEGELQEACRDRLLGGPHWTSDERREALATWLDLTVRQPTARLQLWQLRLDQKHQQQQAQNLLPKASRPKASSSSAAAAATKPDLVYFHGNLARIALMSYFVTVAVRDERYPDLTLPRLLFSTSTRPSVDDATQAGTSHKWSWTRQFSP